MPYKHIFSQRINDYENSNYYINCLRSARHIGAVSILNDFLQRQINPLPRL
jgi:hypothetical protein